MKTIFITGASAGLGKATAKLSVAEVTYQLGFEHPQYFNKLFKSKTSSSPITFRHS